jgi:flavin reductase (DIM6/NTAB) family NADH-FMN oxidoreductase RutF
MFGDRFLPGLGAAPVLKGALASFECHSRHRYHGRDHIILMGLVERYVHKDQSAPLFYPARRYASSPIRAIFPRLRKGEQIHGHQNL